MAAAVTSSGNPTTSDESQWYSSLVEVSNRGMSGASDPRELLFYERHTTLRVVSRRTDPKTG